MKTLKFNSFTCLLDLATYEANDNIAAITLIDQQTGEEVAVATVYHEDLKEGELGIKNWSENEGIYESLIEANVIQKAHRVIESGYVKILVSKFIDTKKDYMKNTLTWQAYMQMKVTLECLKYKKYPNGQLLTPDDVIRLQDEVDRCTELLTLHNISLPKLEDQEGDQFSLFQS